MKKVDAVVLQETYYIATVTAILSLLIQSVFLVISRWDYTVLLGNILGILASVGNFFLMGLTVQSAVTKEPDEAKKLVKMSQSLRFFGLLVVALIAYIIPIFNVITFAIPLLFPRIAISLRPMIIKEK